MKKVKKLQKWSTTSSRYVLKDKWIKVRADACKTKSGEVVSPYYVLEYPDWVRMVVINRNNEILITHQYRHEIKQITTELISGTVDSKDKSHLSAAKRELLEEVGYIGKFTLLGIASPNPANHTNHTYSYLVTNPKQVTIPVINPFEVVQYEFKSVTDILKLIDKKEFVQEMHISSLFLALRNTGMLQV
mgnify:CR=1 FL=1